MEKKEENKNQTPPRWAERLLYWFSDSREIEYIAGDLEELYLQTIQKKGKTRAKMKYIKDVLDMVRPFNLFKNKKPITTAGMYKNYIKIAFRNMMRSKAYSIINVSGLAIGMAATILILLFVQNELSYDRYHENSDRIYRVSRAWYNDSGEVNLHLGEVAPPFGPLIKSDYDGIVEEAVRLMGMTFLVKGDDKAIEEPQLFFSDPNVFKVFTWEVIEGDLTTALDQPNSIVLTRSAAEKYFGKLDVIGNAMSLGNQYLPEPFEVKVTAVIEDIPENSHFHPELIGPMAMVEAYYGGYESFMQAWGSNNFSTYLLLKEGYPYKDLEVELGNFLNKHLMPTSSGRMPNEYNKLSLWPLTDIHLHSQLDSELEPNGDIAYVYLYSMVALFILIIACINFVNLATARSSKRAREVGMRKVMGAVRPMLIRQFIAESLLYAVFALVLSILLVSLVLPWFNNFTQKSLVLDLINNQFLVVLLLGITILTGFVAGSYPAFYLSAYKPVDTLKGEVNAGKAKFGLRSVLVVFQFAISIVLLIGVGVVNDQLDYVKSKDLGFDDNRVLVLPINQAIYNNLLDTKNNLLQNPGIEQVGFASRIPSGRLLDSQGATAEIDGEMKRVEFRIADVHTDHDFLRTLNAPIIAGRDFSFDNASDSAEAFILNEVAVREIGWKTNNEAIGKKFNYGGRQGYITGVVKDFHFEALHQEIAPVVFMISSGRMGNLIVKMAQDKEEETMLFLQEKWSYLMPDYPFETYYIDAQFDAQYANEDRLAELVNYFSVLAIIIGMLGLFGLASYTTEQRFKEIGIRKVLGASNNEVLFILTRGFTFLVFIGFLLAIPIAYFLMNSWLETFAYHGSVNWTTILLAGAVAILLAWITVGFQTYKAARANPIDSIQYE